MEFRFLWVALLLMSGVEARASSDTFLPNRITVNEAGNWAVLWHQKNSFAADNRDTEASKSYQIVSLRDGATRSFELRAPIHLVQWMSGSEDQFFFKNRMHGYVVDVEGNIQSRHAFGTPQYNIEWSAITYISDTDIEDYELISRSRSNRLNGLTISTHDKWILDEHIDGIGKAIEVSDVPLSSPTAFLSQKRDFVALQLQRQVDRFDQICSNVSVDHRRPIFDANSGKLAGCHSTTYATFRECCNLMTFGRSKRDFRTTEFLILNATANKGGTYLLLDNGSGEQAIVVDDRSGLRAIRVLGGKRSKLRSSKVSAFRRIYSNVNGTDGKPIGLLDAGSNATVLQIVFSGGPLLDPVSNITGSLISRQRSPGRDEFYAYYPGSLGAGFDSASNLSVDPERELNDFIAQLTSWIESKAYKKIVVRGDSFGAVFAIKAAEDLSTHSPRLVLSLPLLEFSADKLISGQDRGDPLAMGQSAFENAVFGENISNRKWFELKSNEALEQLCELPDVWIFYASEDQIVRPFAFEHCSNKLPNVKVYDGEDHLSLFSSAQFAADISGVVPRSFMFAD